MPQGGRPLTPGRTRDRRRTAARSAAGALARGFAACLASVTEVPVTDLPRPDDDLSARPGRLAELAGRARIRAGADRRPRALPVGRVVDRGRGGVRDAVAVLAFGTPPGVVLSPQAPALLGRATADLGIREAYAVASSIRCCTGSGRGGLRGTVEGLAVAPAAEAPMRLLEVAQAHAGRGLDGDRYAEGVGTFSSRAGRRPGYDLTLDRRGGPRRAGGGRAGPGLRRHPAQRPHPRHRRQRAGRTALPHRGRAVRGTPAVRALRPPRPAQRTGDPAAAHPPRRPARRRPHRRGDPPGSTGPHRLIGRRRPRTRAGPVGAGPGGSLPPGCRCPQRSHASSRELLRAPAPTGALVPAEMPCYLRFRYRSERSSRRQMGRRRALAGTADQVVLERPFGWRNLTRLRKAWPRPLPGRPPRARFMGGETGGGMRLRA